MKLTSETLKQIQSHFNYEVEDKGWETTSLRFDYWKRVDIGILSNVLRSILGDGIIIVEDSDWDDDCGYLFSYSLRKVNSK
jgi:hypothetical protein